MRAFALTAIAGLTWAMAASAQDPLPVPPVRIGQPLPDAPQLPPLPLAPPSPRDLPKSSPDGFAAELPPGTVVSPPVVRPPMPVDGAFIEVPPGPLMWGSLDFICWRSKGGLLPALVAAEFGSPNQAMPASPYSAFMINDNRINGRLQQGLQLTGGYWLDKPHGTGVEARYTQFFHNEETANYSGTPRTFLVRPFWDQSNYSPALFVLSTPSGAMQGAAQVYTSFDSWGLEGNYWKRGPAMFSEEFHWILGARYWSMSEQLTVLTGSRVGDLQVGTFDTFATSNQFIGPQFGGRWNWTRNKLTIDLMWKLAVGAMFQNVSIDGGTTALLPGGPAIAAPGGFLALAPNSGDSSQVKLSVIRDTTFTIGYAVTENVTLRLGYHIMFVSNIVRPGEQVNLNINPALLPFSAGPPTAPLLPNLRINQEEFYMYGFTLGVQVQF